MVSQNLSCYKLKYETNSKENSIYKGCYVGAFGEYVRKTEPITRVLCVPTILFLQKLLLLLTSLAAHFHGSSSSLTFPLGKPQEALVQYDWTSSTCVRSVSSRMAPYVGTVCLYSRQLSNTASRLLTCSRSCGTCCQMMQIYGVITNEQTNIFRSFCISNKICLCEKKNTYIHFCLS